MPINLSDFGCIVVFQVENVSETLQVWLTRFERTCKQKYFWLEISHLDLNEF